MPHMSLPRAGAGLLDDGVGPRASAAAPAQRAAPLGRAADLACAMSVEALLGSARPSRPEIHALRPHHGQGVSAAAIAAALVGSEIGASHADDFRHAVQDAYSLRA